MSGNRSFGSIPTPGSQRTDEQAGANHIESQTSARDSAFDEPAEQPSVEDTLDGTNLNDVLLDDPIPLHEQLGDDDEVQACMNRAAELFHEMLPDEQRARLKRERGFSDTIIDQQKIGWVGHENEIIERLKADGFSDLTLNRVAIGKSPVKKHLISCTPAESDCRHNMPAVFDTLSNALNTGAVTIEDIDIEALAQAATESNQFTPYCWWGGRIVVPYHDVHGDVRHFVVRETEETSDKAANKYLKQNFTNPFTNNNIVDEPLFGLRTVQDGKPLVVTEGVMDAISLHDINIPCISPITVVPKKEHQEIFLDYVDKASAVYVVMDNEENNAGINGALKCASLIENAEQTETPVVAGIPPTDGSQKTDIDSYLTANTKEDFVNDVLKRAVPPRDHPHYDDEDHKIIPDSQQDSEATQRQTASASNGSSDGGTGSTDIDTPSSGGNQSDLSNLTFEEVISPTANLEWQSHSSVKARGGNPLTTGSTDDSFVVIEDDYAYDHHQNFEVSYNPLTYLAVEAGVRTARNPSGSFTPGEMWKTWYHAKSRPHVGLSDDDPIPLRAMWFLAEEHDLCPADEIPSGFNSDTRLPRDVKNRVLEIVEEEYDLNPGRDPY